MVAHRARRRRADPSLDYGRADRLFRSRFRVAKPFAVGAGLEESLRNFYAVARLQLDVLGWIAPKLPDVVNSDLVAPQEADMLLVGEIIEPAGAVNCS